MGVSMDALKSIKFSHVAGHGEHRSINSVNNRTRGDLPATKVATVQTLHGVFAALYRGELDPDVTHAVGIEADVHDMAVFALALSLNIVFEFLDPLGGRVLSTLS